MKNKKAELNAIAIIILIVFIGLVAFFLIRYAIQKDQPSFNVTKINDTATSTGIQYITRAGAVNITAGTDLTLKDNVINVSSNNTNTNKTLIKVIYPNSTLTPGAIMSTNITEICVSGYSERVRNVSQEIKDSVYIEYKLSPNQPTGAFQIDHLINLANGGSNDIKNLWPQPKEPRPGYLEKDRLETYYHKQVCDGKMDLREAQAILATNWLRGYIDAVQSGGIKINEKYNATEVD